MVLSRSGFARFAGALAAIIVLAGVVWLGWRLFDRDPMLSAPDVPITPALVARGAYLTKQADCIACHTIPGGKSFAGGLEFTLPFGTIYSSNITADGDTGIGSWSDDDFVRALQTGVAKDGSHLYPAFPYTSYTKLSRDDAVAIKAYLFSLPRVHAPPSENSLSFPFNQRWAMMFWNLAFLDQRRFRPDDGLSEEQNRGAYLATALGHCGECHTPRNQAFAMSSRDLAGESLQGWLAYNISSDKRFGIGGWTNEALATYLKAGHAEGHGSTAGPMGEAVTHSLQYWTSDDINAIVAYLRTVKPQPGKAGTEVSEVATAMLASTAYAPAHADESNALGRQIFEGACASCHAWNGNGRQTSYASLRGSQTVSDPAGTNLVQVLLEGADLRKVNAAAFMPAFGEAYSDVEIAAVANYVIGQFGGKIGKVTPNMVGKARTADH